MTYTYTATATSTMTEARMRAVMQKVSANFTAFVVSGLVKREDARRWAEDLEYLQVEEALQFFEVQLRTPGGHRFGLRYTVRSDGSVHQDASSGGLDLYGLPRDTAVNLYAHLRDGTPQRVRDELGRRGWGFNGTKLEGATSEARSFSNNGYGITREKLGAWQ